MDLSASNYILVVNCLPFFLRPCPVKFVLTMLKSLSIYTQLANFTLFFQENYLG